MNHSNYETELFQEVIYNNIHDVINTVQKASSQLTTNLIEQVLQTLEYALLSTDKWDAVKKLLLLAAPKIRQIGYQHEWADCLQQGIAVSQKMDDWEAEAALYFQLGLLQEFKALYDMGRESLTNSASLYGKLDNASKQASALNRLASVVRLQRQYSLAKEIVAEAISLLKPEDNELEFSHFVLGSIALDEDDGVLAEQHYRKSLAICEKGENKNHIAQRKGNIGLALLQQKKYEEAITYYDQSIHLYDDIQDPVHQSIMYMNKGVALLLTEQPDAGLTVFDIAYPALEIAHDTLYLAKLAVNRGVAHRMLNNWEQAEQYLQQSIAYFQEIGNLSEYGNAIEELVSVYRSQKEYKLAGSLLENAIQALTEKEDDPQYSELYEKFSKYLQEFNRLGIARKP